MQPTDERLQHDPLRAEYLWHLVHNGKATTLCADAQRWLKQNHPWEDWQRNRLEYCLRFLYDDLMLPWILNHRETWLCCSCGSPMLWE